MSKPTDDRKPVRVIAFSQSNEPALKTVNVVTSRSMADQLAIKECLQVGPSQMNPSIPTYMDSGGGKTGIKNIYINGYGGPL